MEKKNTLWAFCLKVVLLVVILFGVDRLVGAAFVKMKDVGLATNPENMWLKSNCSVNPVIVLYKNECTFVVDNFTLKFLATNEQQEANQATCFCRGKSYGR